MSSHVYTGLAGMVHDLIPLRFFCIGMQLFQGIPIILVKWCLN